MFPSSYDYIRARVVALDARGDWAPADVSDVLGITLEQYHALLSTPQRSTATDEDDKVTTKLKIKLEIKEEERAEAALRMTREDGVEPMEEGEILEGEQAVGTTLPGGKRSAPTDSTSATRDIKRRKEGGDTADQHQFETFFDSSNVLATPRLDSEDGRLAVGTPVLTIFAEKDSEFAWPAMIVDPSNLEGVPQALVSGTQAPDLYLVRKLPEGGFWSWKSAADLTPFSSDPRPHDALTPRARARFRNGVSMGLDGSIIQGFLEGSTCMERAQIGYQKSLERKRSSALRQEKEREESLERKRLSALRVEKEREESLERKRLSALQKEKEREEKMEKEKEKQARRDSLK